MLPRHRVVIEILESVPIDDEVHDACRRSKQAGSLPALHDFEDRPDWKPLISMADFIKVDVLATSPADQHRLAQTYITMNIRMLAEKVETYDDFHRTKGWGYTYFQGFLAAVPRCFHAGTFPPTR